MTDLPEAAGASPPTEPAAGSPPPGPAPVFGWYIPHGPPIENQPPLGYAAGSGHVPPYGYGPSSGGGPPLGYGHPPAYWPPPGPAPYAAYPDGSLPPYAPGWYPPAPMWGPVRPPSFSKVPHAEPQPYLRLMRTVNYRWWRPVLGILAFIGSYVVAVFLVVLAFVAGGLDLNDLTRLDDLTDPGTLALANASLIVVIPTVWLAWVVHTERLGWSSSVLGRIRWRLLWRYGLLALAILGVGILISLGVGGGIGSTTGFDGREYALLLVVVLISTPLQSAAEEYLFRGYASQAISSWIPSRRTGAVLAALITATLFSLAHAPGDIFTFLDRFAFGLAASAVVWLTGGLEAAIALHAANNVVIFLVIGALGGETSSDIQTGSGTAALIVALDILVMGIYVWIVAKTRERWHPEILSRAPEPADPAAPMAPPAHPPPNWGGGPPGWAGQPSYSPQNAPGPHPGLT